MSRTQKDSRIETPVKATYFFNGETGKCGFLSDESNEIQEHALPLHLIVLDTKPYIIGGSTGIGTKARKIKSTLAYAGKMDKIKVWYQDSKEALLENGTWEANKDRLRAIGAQYTNCMYAYDPKNDCIVRVQFRGKSYAALLEFSKAEKLGNDIAHSLGEREMGLSIMPMIATPSSSGKDSFVPTFKIAKITKPEVNEKADMADGVLSTYFETLFAAPQDVPTQSQDSKNESEPQMSDELKRYGEPTFPIVEPVFDNGSNDEDLPW